VEDEKKGETYTYLIDSWCRFALYFECTIAGHY